MLVNSSFSACNFFSGSALSPALPSEVSARSCDAPASSSSISSPSRFFKFFVFSFSPISFLNLIFFALDSHPDRPLRLDLFLLAHLIIRAEKLRHKRHRGTHSLIMHPHRPQNSQRSLQLLVPGIRCRHQS